MINPPTANSVQFNVLSSLIQLKILFMGGKFFLQRAFRGFIPRSARNGSAATTIEPTEKVPITAFLSIFSVTLFKNYRKRTLKILRSEVFQWPPTIPPRLQSAQNRAYVVFVKF